MKKHLLLSISLLASLWYSDAMAEQTYVTVGTGTSSQYNVPYCNYYKHGSVQLIYPASEMSGAGKITGIAFQVASAQEYATTEVNIYMGSKSSETFASADDYVPLSDLTLVYSGSPKLGTAAGWEEIQLTTPFEYDGSNLVVAIGKHASNYTSNLKYAYTLKSNTVLYRQNDNSSNYGDVDETEIAYTLANTRANVRFTMDLPVTTVGGIIYSCKNGEATVSKTTADLPTEVVIPSSVTYKGQNCTVKYVRMSAFSGNTSITSVSFPSTVVEIDKGSFTGCTALSSVSLSSSLGAIPDNTFWGCSSLTKITVPTSIATIGEYAFCRSGLTEISVPSSVKSIGSHAFYRCDSLASLTLAEGSISRIEDFTFCYCKKLENVKIPESVNYIGRGAFYECLKLETINIPDGVTRLGSFAFKNCINLSEISIPAGIDSIEMHTFYYCRAMTKAELPANLKRIGESAFHYCYDLAECEIPASVTYIGQLAFASCSDLPSISIPSGLEHLGIGAFQSCSSLKSVTVPSCITQIPKNLFSGCYNLKEVQLPDNLIAIGDYGFYGCAINKTNWPATLQSVGYLALGGSSNFKTPVIPKADEYDKLLLWANSAMDKVYCYSEVILPDSVFHVDDIYNTTLYVKPSMLDAYRESQWASRFKSIMPLGDINSDGLYSVADEVLAINTMNGIELPPFNNYRLTNADLTGDGIIDATDLQTQAELIASGDEITPFEPIDPDAPKPVKMLTPSENCTVLYTTGMFGSDTEMALDYINQMRFEACIEGVPNPDKSSTYLKESDFVPIRWSTDLERCCRVRCSESLYTCGHHARLNGKSIGSVSFNGISAGSENLGWGGYGSVMGSINGYYEEKNDLVYSTGDVVGHYTNLIAPSHKYIGVSSFGGCSATETKSTDLSAFESHFLAPSGYDTIRLDVKSDYIDGYRVGTYSSINNQSSVSTGTHQQMAIWAHISPYSDCGGYLIVPYTGTFVSSDPEIASIDEKGRIDFKKAGTVTVTGSMNGEEIGTRTYTIVCKHDYYYDPVENSKTTGRCAKCGVEIAASLPTYLSIYWNNSESGTGSYGGLYPKNPVGSYVKPWIYATGGTSPYNTVLVTNDRPDLLETTPEASGICSWLVKGVGEAHVTFTCKYNTKITRSYTINCTAEGDGPNSAAPRPDGALEMTQEFSASATAEAVLTGEVQKTEEKFQTSNVIF